MVKRAFFIILFCSTSIFSIHPRLRRVSRRTRIERRVEMENRFDEQENDRRATRCGGITARDVAVVITSIASLGPSIVRLIIEAIRG